MNRENRAKLFWSGRSQAVRLPKEYRFEGTEVRISRRGDAVILEPVATDWQWLDDLVASHALDADFVEGAEASVAAQERPTVDEYFQ